MKKEYIKPEMQVYKLETMQLVFYLLNICNSKY